jgi:diguanylate cyclase (GGDEF)-like protein
MSEKRRESPRVAMDTLVFHVAERSLSLIGGNGRGEGWSGIVDLTFDEEPVAAGVHGSSRPAHVDGDREPVRIIGPYWARHAVLVPVGGEHLVVFGSDEPLPDSAPTLVQAAAHLVAEVQHVSPATLLADELELVHAIRDLIEYRPENVAETARHIAEKAAEPLACEVGAVLLHYNGELVAEVATRNWEATLDLTAIRGTLVSLFQRAASGAFVDLEIPADAGDALGRAQGLVARFVVPIGRPTPFGVLVVAHAATHARGFTNLCQRIGYALAEVAESLLVQAMSRERLAADRDRFAREARIDPLTGLENRAAWDEHVRAEEARRVRYSRSVTVVSADLDNLKAVNDRYGHEAGDQLIRAAANLLRGQARGADRIARVGGDEFLLLMPETDMHGAERYLSRVRSAIRRIQTNEVSALQLSFGAATAGDKESLAAVIGRADAAMYAAKKRRVRKARVAASSAER